MGVVACNQKTSESQKLDTNAIETDQNSNKEPAISFNNKIWDFGTITDGEVVEHTFRFTNTGTKNLVISSASASCGCTIPEWPKEPIAPGAEGEMFVIFNSDGKNGKQHKKVSVIANTEPATTVVALKGDVLVPEASEDAAEPIPVTEEKEG